MIVDSAKIEDLLSYIVQPDALLVDGILAEAAALNGLSLEDAAALLSVENPDSLERIFMKAGEIKERNNLQLDIKFPDQRYLKALKNIKEELCSIKKSLS